ncbi:hypothetical protein P1X14_16040 [Sphingomonas sp. AOB5]|uniref:SecDF P1 head subdomain-containing protein n=1 Tax=Sphingomonas sp. AOB5 TaxID=3034017 RepID=UPI0023F9BB49|nr:hypothetical protein [Sphingomonas sp. AOB5]MDF7776769.1 hypothetical protein [Sphingomonas sp. AOB5]
MLLLFAALLSSAAPLACPPRFPSEADLDSSKPVERSGAGLWIAGTPFPAADLAEAVAREHPDHGWQITIRFRDAGIARFAEISRCRQMQMAEISVDDILISRPVFYEEIRGGEVMLSGGLDHEQATAFVARLTPAAH